MEPKKKMVELKKDLKKYVKSKVKDFKISEKNRRNV